MGGPAKTTPQTLGRDGVQMSIRKRGHNYWEICIQEGLDPQTRQEDPHLPQLPGHRARGAAGEHAAAVRPG